MATTKQIETAARDLVASATTTLLCAGVRAKIDYSSAVVALVQAGWSARDAVGVVCDQATLTKNSLDLGALTATARKEAYNALGYALGKVARAHLGAGVTVDGRGGRYQIKARKPKADKLPATAKGAGHSPVPRADRGTAGAAAPDTGAATIEAAAHALDLSALVLALVREHGAAAVRAAVDAAAAAGTASAKRQPRAKRRAA